jgi:hypothetical protein
MLGDSFYHLINLSMTRLEEFVGGKPKKGEDLAPELKLAREWSVEDVTGNMLTAANVTRS